MDRTDPSFPRIWLQSSRLCWGAIKCGEEGIHLAWLFQLMSHWGQRFCCSSTLSQLGESPQMREGCPGQSLRGGPRGCWVWCGWGGCRNVLPNGQEYLVCLWEGCYHLPKALEWLWVSEGCRVYTVVSYNPCVLLDSARFCISWASFTHQSSMVCRAHWVAVPACDSWFLRMGQCGLARTDLWPACFACRSEWIPGVLSSNQSWWRFLGKTNWFMGHVT